MFDYLRGEIVKKDLNSLTVDVHGIGYKIHTTAQTLESLRGVNEGTLFTHLNLREDEVILYGFSTEEELAMFHQLRSVSKIGSKVACGILSHYSPKELANLIQKGAVSMISKAPGVGKKTAERMIVELKDKIPQGLLMDQSQSELSTDMNKDMDEDLEVLQALSSLGYSRQEGEKALKIIGVNELTLNQKIKEALKVLMR